MRNALSFLILLASLRPLALSASPPRLDYPPKDQTVVLYQQTAFGVIASGSGQLSYQWLKDGASIPGATNDQVIVKRVRFADAGLYSVRVTDGLETATSVGAKLVVVPPRPGDVDTSFYAGGALSEFTGGLALQKDGKILLGMEGIEVSGIWPRMILRLNSNGVPDYTFVTDARLARGVVLCLAVQSDGKIIAGGQLTMFEGGKVRGAGIARLHPDGSLDTNFVCSVEQAFGVVGGSGIVQCIIPLPDGRILISGSFTFINGTEQRGFARLKPDGALDRTFLQGWAGLGYGGAVAIALQPDGRIIIGGGTTIKGVVRPGVARLNANGSIDQSFHYDSAGSETNSAVTSVAIAENGNIVVASDSYWLNGLPRSVVTRLRADGSVDSSFRSASGSGPLAVQPDGKIMIGGTRLNPDGSLDAGFAPIENPTAVNSMLLQPDGKLILLGYSFETNGAVYARINRFNIDGSGDARFDPQLSGLAEGLDYSNASLLELQPDGSILIRQSLSANNSTLTRLSKLNADGTPDPRFHSPAIAALISAARVHPDGTILAAGFVIHSSLHGGSVLYRFLADGTLEESLPYSPNDSENLQPDGRVDTSFLEALPGISASLTAQVSSIALQSDGRIIVGGAFLEVNGVPRAGLARLYADGTLDESFRPPFTGTIANGAPVFYAIALQKDGKVLVAGGFGAAHGVRSTNVARLNPDGSEDLTFQAGFSELEMPVSSLLLQPDGQVLIAGSFQSIHGLPARGIARLWGSGDIPPNFSKVNRESATTTLEWDALPGRTYRVQYKQTLAEESWTNLAGDIQGSSPGLGEKSDFNAALEKQRLYRVLLLP